MRILYCVDCTPSRIFGFGAVRSGGVHNVEVAGLWIPHPNTRTMVVDEDEEALLAGRTTDEAMAYLQSKYGADLA